MRNHLLIITPQEDFCNSKGSVYYLDADIDMFRLSNYIKRYKLDISDITIKLEITNYISKNSPPYCVQGTWGSNVNLDLLITLNKWSKYHNKNVNYLYEGIPVKNNFSAEYFIDISKNCDSIIVAGILDKTKSHIENLINTISNKDFSKKIVILKNCISLKSENIPDAIRFFNFVRRSGGTISKVTQPSCNMKQTTIEDYIKQRIQTVRNIIQ
jgi:hypothetical protein